jgi:hypothetical protein
MIHDSVPDEVGRALCLPAHPAAAVAGLALLNKLRGSQQDGVLSVRGTAPLCTVRYAVCGRKL